MTQALLVILGGIMSIGGGYANNRWQSSREREARSEELDARRTEGMRLAAVAAASFQHDTLIGVQQGLGRVYAEVVRIVKVYVDNEDAGRPTRDPKDLVLEEPWRTALQELARDASRIVDDDLRALVGSAARSSQAVVGSTSVDAAVTAGHTLAQIVEEATEMAGTVLRGLPRG